MRDAHVVLADYLLGSIPFGYLVAKATTGKDIRLEGDGNVGTRNEDAGLNPHAKRANPLRGSQ